MPLPRLRTLSTYICTILLGMSTGVVAVEKDLPAVGEGRLSNMMASIPAYNEYATNVLMADMDPAVLPELMALEAEEDYADSRFTDLLFKHHYVYHVLRMPLEAWPDEINRAFGHMNTDVYTPMQGPSELGASGLLADWDRTADIKRITVPTLVIGATYDTMDPAHMQWMVEEIPSARFLLCPNGAHLAQWDDEENYFNDLNSLLKDIDAGKFVRGSES